MFDQLDVPAIAGGVMVGLRITAEVLLAVNRLIPAKYSRVSLAVNVLAKLVAWFGVGKPKKLG